MAVLATSARLGLDDVLRIRWAETPGDATTLVLRQRGSAESVPLDGDAADLSDLVLSDGAWSVHAGGEEVMTTDLGFSLDALADYGRRRHDRLMHTFRGRSGGLRILVRAMEPYAEVTAVHPHPERLVLEGYFAFGGSPDGTGVVATRRRTGEQVTGEVTVTGDRWRAELPNEPFAVESDRGFWDLRMGGLTVAAFLDDIAQKKTKVRFPEEHVGRGGDRVRVRAYYTDKDHLAIATTVVSNAETS